MIGMMATDHNPRNGKALKDVKSPRAETDAEETAVLLNVRGMDSPSQAGSSSYTPVRSIPLEVIGAPGN